MNSSLLKVSITYVEKNLLRYSTKMYYNSYTEVRIAAKEKTSFLCTNTFAIH